MYVQVHVHKPLPTPYTYLVPTRLRDAVGPGSRVEVPLGRGKVMGVVVEVLAEKPKMPGVPVFKPVYRVLEQPPALSPELLALGLEVADYYLCAPGEALHAMVPSYAPPSPPPRFVLAKPFEQAEAEVSPRAKRQLELLLLLAEAGEGGLRRRQLVAKGADAPLRALIEKGVVRQLGKEVPLLEPAEAPPAPAVESFPGLTDHQAPIFEAVREDLAARRHAVHLLHGVTGSGKTEIYLRLMREAVAAGRGALFLVPEIALTVTMIDKVRARFGDGLAVLHSKMGARERYLEWARLRRGEVRVVLGPRSAVFAPVADLGLVILDEEHEGSYKQQDKPRYHAREVATWRGRDGGFPVVLGSATPSLEAYQAAQAGASRYHRMTRRFRQAALPPVELVDMSTEFRTHKNRSIFSMRLKERLEAVLGTDGQALLFMNRRGFHTHVFCRSCGFTLECQDCSVPMTYHLTDNRCLCHHCGARQAAPRECPDCSSRAFRYAGTGTQRVARDFGLNFPGVVFDRMDSDTTRRKGAHERILGAYSRGETRVLIGTQMVTKGFDFPRLNLVGVVNADSGLTMPDFRAAERTFQTLTQVAGRAGRGEDPGEVVVQTYRPEHYALQAACRHDYEGFAAEEIPQRQALFYPPFARLILLVHEGPDEARAERPLEELARALREELPSLGRVRVLGPVPAPLRKIERRFRAQLLLKVDPDPEVFAKVRGHLRGHAKLDSATKVDVDPSGFL